MGEEFNTLATEQVVDNQPVEQHVEATTDPAPQENVVQEPKSERPPQWAVKVDARTGRRSIVNIEEETEPKQPEPAPQPQPVQTTAQQYMQPLEQQAQQTPQPAPQPVPQPQPQPPAPQPQTEEERMKAKQEFFGMVENMARDNALKDVGITEDDLAVMEYSDDPMLKERAAQFKSAMAYHRDAIVQKVKEQQMRAQRVEQERMEILNDVTNYVKDIQEKEQYANEIFVKMDNYYNELPYQEAKKYQEAMTAAANRNISPEQAVVLKEYYERTRATLYAQKHGLNTVPTKAPIVESGGGSNPQDFNNQPITKEMLAKNAHNYKAQRAMISQVLARMQRR